MAKTKRFTNISNKDLLDNALSREIFSVRMVTLRKNILDKLEGKLIEPHLEDKSDSQTNAQNEASFGGIFLPGYWLIRSTDNQEITTDYNPHKQISETIFRKNVREYLKQDGATLIFQDGELPNISLDNGFFGRMAVGLLRQTRDDHRKILKLKQKNPRSPRVDQITKSYFIHNYSSTQGYGERLRITSCIAACVRNLFSYKSLLQFKFELTDYMVDAVYEGLKKSQYPVMGKSKDDKDVILAPNFMIALHSSRYFEQNLVGLIRYLGYGKNFGEFTSLTFEEADKNIISELKNEKELTPDKVIAEYGDKTVVAVLRKYSVTNLGTRNKNYEISIVSPERDLGMTIDKIVL